VCGCRPLAAGLDNLGKSLAFRVIANATVDRDLNIWHGSGDVFRPLRIEPDGRPVYDFTKPERCGIPSVAAIDPEDGSIFSFSEGEESAGSHVCLARTGKDGAMMWDYRGAIHWPRAINLPPRRPGKFRGATALLGVAGDFTGYATYFGTHHVYTSDGICVAMIFRDPRLATSIGADVIATENCNGQLVKPKGMNRYFALAGDQDGRITEVLGLDTVKRLPGGTLTITEADAKRVADAQATYKAGAKRQVLALVRGREALEAARPVSKSISGTQAFEARAAYDDKNLYVMFNVTSPAPLVSGMADPQLVFKGGNVLDIQLAADPTADHPARKAPVPGDVRILVSQRNGKPVAVAYRPKVQGFKGQPIVFRTGNVESFDSIDVNDQISLEYKQLTIGTFQATAIIPLSVAGLQPRPGTRIRMDVGCIYGNNEGTKAMARSYWTNNGFSANVLNDVPNESKLEPAMWGEAEVQ